MNSSREYKIAFEDKNLLTYIASGAGVRMPKTLLSACEGLYRDRDGRPVSQAEAESILGSIGEAFIKPSAGASSGAGCRPVNMKDGTDELSGKYASELIASLGRNFVVQEKLICSEDMSGLHRESVNTFRVITYRWKDDICSMPAIMRIGVGKSNVDNAHAGGIFIAVSDNGDLFPRAYTEFGERYTSHPDSGILFDGYHIAGFEKVIKTARRMHAAIPQLGVINWDLTIDKDGEPVLIEANCRFGSVWLVEMAHGSGAFGDRTAEVLRWLKLMKDCRPAERSKYAYGRGV